MPISPHAVVLDADNTLWNTNTTFRRAREAMIEVLRSGIDVPVQDPSDNEHSDNEHSDPEQPIGASSDSERSAERTDVLYRLSQHLPSAGGEGPDLERLARAAAFYMSGRRGGPEADVQTDRLRWASEQVQAGRRPPGCDEARARTAAEAFRAALREAPPLLDGADSLLRRVGAWRGARPDRRASVLFSEGGPDRLEVAFEAHEVGEGQYFDDIVLREKTPTTFRGVCRSIGKIVEVPDLQTARIVVIGDSLKRDIRPANAAGCTTVYCPGDLWGQEAPAETAEQPDYTIGRIDDALDILDLHSTDPQDSAY
ncbi:HAD family hydrolase [Salinibacter grassmerensis]|uniref:HAD family hydrolase n=1 Tax=Salinibacter grassmerensis TaxID=3040353 RepID=UPI0021E89B69|nr:HAD hydrolase-like protein [Salinibacter grassmerensis]